VEWQRTFPALDIFWVVNLNFIDNVEPMVFEAVKQNLARGVRYVYFVREEDTAPGREFDLLLHRLRMSVGDAAVVRQIVPVPVSATDLQSRFRDLIFDFVVANPQLTRQGTSVAFQNVREGGQVAFAVGLKHFDATVNRLREYAFEQNLTAVWDTMAACCTA